MVDPEQRKTVERAVGTVGATLILLGVVLDDPLALGSRDVYLFPGIMALLAPTITDDQEPRDALIAASGMIAGGILFGVGSLPVSHPLWEPIYLAGTRFADGGAVELAGLVVFCVGFGWEVTRSARENGPVTDEG